MPKSEKVKINVKERVDDDTIDLSLSDISEIPVNEIAKYKRATILDLSSNRITELGKNFGTLSHLTKLDLSKNQIKSLPDDIGKLANLRHLDLYNNKLEHLPVSFGRLKSLRYLDLKGNPLASALAKIIGPCVSTKECQEAARKIVKFMADYQIKLNEQQKEKRHQEELDKAAAATAKLEAENQRKLEIEKQKAKAKRERKKENKKQQLAEMMQEKQNGFSSVSTSISTIKKTCSFFGNLSIFRFVIFTFFLWFLLIAVAVINVVKFPHYTTYIVDKLPENYQPIVSEYVEYVRQHVKLYLKSS